MAPRAVLARIDDMLEMIDFIRKSEAAATGSPSWMVRLAVERAFSILSEASRHIPQELKHAEPDIPWRDIAGIGSVLRHDYQSVSENVLRNATAVHLTPLEQALLRLKANLSSGTARQPG